MRAEHVDAFLASAFQLLGRQAEGRPERGSPLLRTGDTCTSRELTALVRFDGGLTGVTFYSMSVATARKLAVVTGSETAGEGEAHEAISELARQVSEAGTGLLGAKGCECVLESPQLIQGFGEPLTTASPVLIVPLFTEYGDIDFGIALRPSDECSTAWAAEVEEGAT